jgi:5-methylcytosine-specific restriction endonuclease McrA
MSERDENLARVIGRIDRVRSGLENAVKGVKGVSVSVPRAVIEHHAAVLVSVGNELRTLDGGSADRRVLKRDRDAALARAWDAVRGFWVCADCRIELRALVDVAVDHVIPLARGGANDAANLQVLCVRCNLKKGAKAA